VLGVLVLLSLAGCGFEPLYGEHSAAGRANLSGVRVATIQDLPDPTGGSPSSARAAQLLRNNLLDRVNARGRQSAAEFELHVTLTETKLTAIGIRTDETATRGTLTLVASYTLVRYDGGGAVMAGSTRSDVSYNILRNEFATLAAETDARRNAVREISETIALEAANAVGAYRKGIVK
jgi:LPS-assembly lipoprotein